MCLDRGPADDTRAAALRHPIWAAMYAADVDRAGRDDTRRAASAHGIAVELYARAIDLAIAPEARALVIRDAGHDASTLAQLEAQLATVAGGTKRADGPARVITVREFPSNNIPRYVEKAGKRYAPPSKELRSDIDAFIPRGLARLGFSDDSEPAVAEVLDRWDGDAHRYFRLRADDGCVYILRHDLRGDFWELRFFRNESAAH